MVCGVNVVALPPSSRIHLKLLLRLDDFTRPHQWFLQEKGSPSTSLDRDLFLGAWRWVFEQELLGVKQTAEMLRTCPQALYAPRASCFPNFWTERTNPATSNERNSAILGHGFYILYWWLRSILNMTVELALQYANPLGIQSKKLEDKLYYDQYGSHIGASSPCILQAAVSLMWKNSYFPFWFKGGRGLMSKHQLCVCICLVMCFSASGVLFRGSFLRNMYLYDVSVYLDPSWLKCLGSMLV